MVSFTVQKFIHLIRSYLSVYVFISIALEDWPKKKKKFIRFMSENMLLPFSYRSLMVSYLMFKSLRHFEFIFVHVVEVCFNLIDLCAAVQLSQCHSLKRFISRLSLLFHSLILIPVFVPVRRYFDYCSFVVFWSLGELCLLLCFPLPPSGLL